MNILTVKIPCFPPLDYKHILQVYFAATCSGKCLSWKASDFQSDNKCLFSLLGFWLEIYLEYREPGFSFCSAQSQTKPHGSSCTSPGQGHSRNYPQNPYFGNIRLKAWRWWIYTLSPEALMEIMYHHLHFSNEKGEGHMREDIYLLSAKTPETAAGAGPTSPISESTGYPSVDWIIWTDTQHCHRVTGDFLTRPSTVTLSDTAAHVSPPGSCPHNKHKINAGARHCKTLHTNRTVIPTPNMIS